MFTELRIEARATLYSKKNFADKACQSRGARWSVETKNCCNGVLVRLLRRARAGQVVGLVAFGEFESLLKRLDELVLDGLPVDTAPQEVRP